MNFFDDDDDDIRFEPFDCRGMCPFYRQPVNPFGPPTPPPFNPGGAPGQQGPGSGPPAGPPPKSVPQQSQAKTFGAGGPSTYAVDPGALRPCTYRFVYLWLRNGQQFWAWLIYVGRTSASGWRWNGRRWVYFGTDLRRIESFVCY